MIFLARAAATGFGKVLLGTAAGGKATVRAAVVPAAAPVYSKQVEEILKRNIFCSGCPPILPKEGGPAEVNLPPPLQRTALNLKLLAIMFAPPPADPHWS